MALVVGGQIGRWSRYAAVSSGGVGGVSLGGESGAWAIYGGEGGEAAAMGGEAVGK